MGAEGATGWAAGVAWPDAALVGRTAGEVESIASSPPFTVGAIDWPGEAIAADTLRLLSAAEGAVVCVGAVNAPFTLGVSTLSLVRGVSASVEVPRPLPT